MLIFLYGPDSYRRQKKLNKLIGEYRHKHSNLSCDFFDLENPDEFARLKEFSRQQLIFDSKKLAVLQSAFTAELKGLKEFFKIYLNIENLIILISEDNSPPGELGSLLKKAFLVDKFNFLEGDAWLFFIRKEAAQRKISLTSRTVYFLARFFQNNTWGLINELDKISLFKRKINAEEEAENNGYLVDVDDLIKIGDYQYDPPDIFGFINMVIQNWSSPEKIVALEKLFLNQEEPLKIFNILSSSQRLSRNLIQKLAAYDVMVKSGKMDHAEVLVDLALSG